MIGKKVFDILRTTLALLAMGAFLAAAERCAIPGGEASLSIPQEWSATSGSLLALRGPGKNSNERPTITVAFARGDITTTVASLRAGYQRVTDGYESVSEDEIPLGGRVWQRLRTRFATGPLVFLQTAWVGSVGEATLVIVLSGPDEQQPALLHTAADVITSITTTP